MPQEENYEHIRVQGYTQSTQYVSPRTFGRSPVQTRNRVNHGRKIKEQLELIKSEFEGLKNLELPSGIIRDDAVYVEFISAIDFQPVFDSLQSDARDPKYVLLSSKKLETEEGVQFRVNVVLTEGGISHFLKKVEEYLTKDRESGKPYHEAFVNNLESIQLATLEAFWNEPDQISFPTVETWWEVWFRRKGVDFENDEKEKVYNQLHSVGAQVGELEVVFPEHIVRLVKATPEQLSSSLMLLDSLAELRKPKDTAEFFLNLGASMTEEAIQDLKDRIRNETEENSIAICLLDSGVQNGHTLIRDFFRENSLHSYKPEDWGVNDDWPNHGHGTGMAGLALFGNLTELLAGNMDVLIYHQMESVKIIQRDDPTEVHLYAALTEESVNRPVVTAPNRPRVYCLAVTDKDQSYKGRPSSWSASLDKIAFGNVTGDNEKQLLLVSSGNVVHEHPNEYPSKNHIEGVHDPGQAFNVITIGSYTDFDTYSHEEFPNSTLMAHKGGMSPSNSTSLLWEGQWPIKPDLVMEGGNALIQDDSIVKPESLQLLSTGRNMRVKPLISFGDTSGATALASRLSAAIKVQYPDLWPETVRGLLIHSATWTDRMLNNRTLKQLGELSKLQKQNILRVFGHGVPNLERALNSKRNSLTLIAEEIINPFNKDGFNEIHYLELPWPSEILQNALAEVDVKLTITLSYFIDPNPGNRIYGSKFNYQSHSLRFNLVKPGETFDEFQKRMNKLARLEEEDSSFAGESWVLGEQLHSKGSIHKDYWIGSGADLSTRNIIAIRPGVGWYRSRKKLKKYDDQVRYSLIVTIESKEVEVDIYTPVLNQIPIQLRS
ncbi:MAG: S8 family peptidase [Cytophagia bacterium]|nr:S8 family peptidase [Cytophagia bacterium]